MLHTSLYAPIIIILAALITVLYLQFSKKTVIKIEKFYIKFELPNNTFTKLLLLILAFAPLTYYVTADFSDLFPRHLEFEVFYDEPGLKRELAAYDKKELSRLGYHDWNSELRSEYFQENDKVIEREQGVKDLFSMKCGTVHSKGNSSIEVKKVWGFNNYELNGASGSLVHIREAPGNVILKSKSTFEKSKSSYDHIRPNLWEIISGNGFPVIHEFKQIIPLSNRPDDPLFDHTLLALMRVFILPEPIFSDAVYFYKTDEGELVPIGYGRFK